MSWQNCGMYGEVAPGGMRRHSMQIEAEQEKKERKDERKRIRESRQADVESALCCDHPGCSFAAVNKAGLTNHKRQKHTLTQAAVCFCRQSFQKEVPQPPTFLQE